VSFYNFSWVIEKEAKEVRQFSLNMAMNSLMELNKTELDNDTNFPEIVRYFVGLEGGDEIKPLIGLVNTKIQAIVCEPKFTYVGEFVDRVAPCKVGKFAGYVKNDGTYLISPREEYIDTKEVINGICRIQISSGKWKLYSIEKGDFITSSEFSKVEVIGKEDVDINVTVFKVYDEAGRLGLIRSDGIWIFSPADCATVIFVTRNIAVISKRGNQSLFNFVTNKFMVTNVNQITMLETEGYFSYFDNKDGCVLYKITNNNGEVLMKKYSSYTFLNDILVACGRFSIDNEGEEYDLFNIELGCHMQNDIARYDRIRELKGEYWYIQKESGAGVITRDGKTICKPNASKILPVSRDVFKVCIEGLWGAYSVTEHDWVVLPQYTEVSAPDRHGIFRVAKEVESGTRYGRKHLEWSYIKKGMPLTKERFLEAEPFQKGVARVVTLDGEVAEINMSRCFFSCKNYYL